MSRIAVLLALLAVASAARAQVSTPGTPAGEPVGAFGSLRVASQQLTLDLRPLARRPGERRAATVEATYELVNEGDARPVALALAAAAAGDAEVWLDGERVAGTPAGTAEAPDAWQPTETSPPLGDTGPFPLAFDATAPAWRFAATVPPGRHVLRVRQRLAAGSFQTPRAPMRVWQLAYSLAPARFRVAGRLAVTVRPPAGWAVAPSLPLRRETDAEGTALVGQFAGVPGDVLVVSARAPEPAGRLPLRLAGLVAALGAVVAAGAVGARRAGTLGRALVAVTGGLLAAAALVGTHVAAARLGDASLHVASAAAAGLTVVGPLALAVGAAAAWALSRPHSTS